ncbi:hypothetical protein HMN09_01385900 [Mycena chlorophos]|uniref:Translin n=1 Tax=Mycena chlorophos TaxID=658473 RepID=A0A8H6RX86_MYCCL|nr:hypothetical protein HMN09_01385900 [Mycena chlorophos]
MDAANIDVLNSLLEKDSNVGEVRVAETHSRCSTLRQKIREQVKELDKKVRLIVGILGKIHSTPPNSMQPLLATVDPVLLSCHEHIAAIANAIPPDQYWRWKDMWSNDIRSLVFAVALMEYLKTRSLISLEKSAELLGIQDEWKDRIILPVEDYLLGLINMVNELSRFAVNAVTLGDFEEPMRISTFVKDIFSGFTMVGAALSRALLQKIYLLQLNLKNDLLRRKFDTLKYDLKKIEEGKYDLVLRGLIAERLIQSRVRYIPAQTRSHRQSTAVVGVELTGTAVELISSFLACTFAEISIFGCV